MGTVQAAWLLLAFVLPCAGFYLPGVAPIEYEKGHKVDLKVNKLTSTKTQLPYEWCGTRATATPLEAAWTPCFCGVQVLTAVLQAGRGRQSGGEPGRGTPGPPPQRSRAIAGRPQRHTL
jgi:hypothetical protein